MKTGERLSDRYEIRGEIGRGGMGVVYLAYEESLDRSVAVKLILPGLLTPEIRDRFQREARVVAKMDHPNIVGIHHTGEHEGSLYLVMPYVQGHNLRHLLDQGKLSLKSALLIAEQVAEALEYSHSTDIIHRDIKPENILVTHDPQGDLRVRVTDFGLAIVSREQRFSNSGSIAGTFAYLSPEQVIGNSLDGRADIYSLGTVLYECLCGQTPFAGEVQQLLYRIAHDQPPAFQCAVDEELMSLVMECLQKDPSTRPQTAREMAERLRLCRQRLQTDGRSEMRLEQFPRVRFERRARPAFVGRERERQELQHRLSEALAGECQIVLIGGEPGAGKSRLLEEVETLARGRGFRVLRGRFQEQDRSFPYQGFCEILQDHFRSGSSAAAIDFRDLAPELLLLFPVLGEIPALKNISTGSHPSLAEPRKMEDRTRIFELLARSLSRMAGGEPMMLILEDLHLAEVSLEALQYVVHRLGPTPLMIAGTYRSSEIDKRHPLNKIMDSFQGDRRFDLITIRPFTFQEFQLFLLNIGGKSDFDPELIGKLYEATEGNPYFTSELVRSLMETGAISHDPSGLWVLSEEGGISDALPGTIQQAVERRIERLAEELREIVSAASVLGKTFDYRSLERLMEGKERLEESVDRLIHDGILEEEPESKGNRLSFSSGIIREVLYALLTRRRRRMLHLRYAEYLESRYAGRLERVYSQLVHHYSRADVAEKVIDFGLKHARKSLEAFSAVETIRTLREVLEFLEEEDEGQRHVEAEVRLLLGSAYRMAGSVDAALNEFDAAVRLYGRNREEQNSIHAMVLAAETAFAARKAETAVRWIERGLRAARMAGAAESLARLLSLASTVANLRGETGLALQYLEEVEKLRPSPRDEKAEELPAGGTLKVALPYAIKPGHPSTIKVDEEAEILANVFEPLIKVDPDGNLIPWLCESWDPQEGGRVFRISLRQGIRFQDGAALTAEEVRSSFELGIRSSGTRLPPAFAAVKGVAEFATGAANRLGGIHVISSHALDFHLKETLPIFPALLSDMKSSIVRMAPPGASPVLLSGTGPFQIDSFHENGILLSRNPDYWRKAPVLLEAIHFSGSLTAATIAAGFRSGQFDLVHDLLPQHLEDILRDKRQRANLVEAPKKNCFFLLFNTNSPLCKEVSLRRALCSVLRVQQLVRRALGRHVQPAVSLLPPGILGYDPERRHRPAGREEAVQHLQAAGISLPLTLRASVHPAFQDRYASLTRELLDLWKGLGIEISIETPDMDSFLQRLTHSEEIDLMLGRWIVEYEDPDCFTFALFHSRMGDRKSYFCSPEMDLLLEEARAESRPLVREKIYRRVENLLLDPCILLPLFHEIDYRVAQPRVRRLTLRSTPPYVNYSELAIAETPSAADSERKGGGVLHVPFNGTLRSLDPSLCFTVAQIEALPTIFNTLMETPKAQVMPCLAASCAVEEGGTRFRFRLRENVRFHDGRRLTARDVRYSFERLLQNRDAESRWFLAPVKGARKLLNSEVGDLEGFRILSHQEFTIELEKPMAFFPALLASPATGIVPEGADSFLGSWRDGCVGTGPFRVVRFDPAKRLDLEANPNYWRSARPMSEGIVFHFGLSPQEIVDGFLSNRFSIAWNLQRDELEAMRLDPQFASRYREAPSLSTYYLAMNIHDGPLAEQRLRHQLVDSLDVATIVRRSAGRLAIPTNHFIPPGLPGHQPHHASGSVPARRKVSSPLQLRVMLNSAYEGPYAALAADLLQSLAGLGIETEIIETKSEYVSNQAGALAQADLLLTRWFADYPDPDNFVHLLHSEEGFIGRLCGKREIDRLIEAGRLETNAAARHDIYREIEEMIRSEAILLPLFHEQSYCFASPEVQDLEFNFFSPFLNYETTWLRR